MAAHGEEWTHDLLSPQGYLAGANVGDTGPCIALTLVVGAIIFATLGYDPLQAFYQFFVAPVSRPDQVADLFVKACPLIIIASGLIFCYRANVWNIGAEGQLILGAVFSGYVALTFPGLPGW